MTARTQADLRRGLALGDGQQAAFSAACSDEQIAQFCEEFYSWKEVKLTRDEAIVRARPAKEEGK
jgi:hypothetical protein